MSLLDRTPCSVRQAILRQSSPRHHLAGAVLSIAVLFSSTTGTLAQAVQLVAVDVKAVAQGFQVSKLLGANVRNDKDEGIGEIGDIVITKERAIFPILQVGGFLGLGAHLVAIPYESLNISDDGRTIKLAGASKEALQKLPEFEFKK